MVGNVSLNKLKIYWFGLVIRVIVGRWNGKFVLLKRNLWNNKLKKIEIILILCGKLFVVVFLKSLFCRVFF